MIRRASRGARHAAAAALLGLASTAGNVRAARLGPDPSTSLAALEAGWSNGRVQVAASPGGCTLGLQVEERGRTIIGVEPPAAATSVRAGDTLTSVNGVWVGDGAAYALLVAGLPVKSVARVDVERAGTARTVAIACADRGRWRRTLLGGIDAALHGHYTACLDIARRLDGIAGLRTGHAKLRYECALAARITTGRSPTAEDDILYFDIYRRLALPARYSAAYREQVRERVEWAAGSLRRTGATDLADRLMSLLGLGI